MVIDIDQDQFLRTAPHSTKKSERGKTFETKALVKISEPTKLSAILAKIAGHESIERDPVIPAGTYILRSRVDVQVTSR